MSGFEGWLKEREEEKKVEEEEKGKRVRGNLDVLGGCVYALVSVPL